MKNRFQIFRFGLIALAWLLVLIALPMPAGNLNAFLRWRGEFQTWFFLQWLFRMPRQVMRDYLQYGTFYWMDTAWMLIMVLGLLLLFFAPILIFRVRKPVGTTVLRCFAPAMLLLPVTICLPAEYRFPIAGPGLWLLGAAHVLGFLALVLQQRVISPEGAFPVRIDQP